MTRLGFSKLLSFSSCVEADITIKVLLLRTCLCNKHCACVWKQETSRAAINQSRCARAGLHQSTNRPVRVTARAKTTRASVSAGLMARGTDTDLCTLFMSCRGITQAVLLYCHWSSKVGVGRAPPSGGNSLGGSDRVRKVSSACRQLFTTNPCRFQAIMWYWTL